MTDIELHPDFAPAPTTIFASNDPAQIVAQATRIADVIAPLIRERNLVKRIGNSEHVYLEAWALAGTMLGVFATTVRTWMIGEDEGYGATVEARSIAGALVGRAEAVVMRDEEVGGKRKWLEAPRFQLISMAQTRASSKALRMPLGFVMKLAGYDTTPAEEMEAAAARGEPVSGGRGVAHGWRDKLEQDRAHRRLADFVAEYSLAEPLEAYLQSKGYDRPLAKGQLNQVEKAMVRELQERGQQTAGPGASHPPDASGSATTSEGPATRTGEVPGQPGRHRGRPSDDNASATGSGDTDASTAGQEPPDAEASTSPSSPGDGTAGRGRGRHAGPGRSPDVSPSPAEPAQAALDDGSEPPGWET